MKSRKSRHETAVQGTNDSSIVSKCSTAQQGYFDDSYLQSMVARTSRRAPLIHRGYYIRFMTVDCAYKSFLQAIHQLPSQHCQVLSLGAGFDTAFFRLTQQSLLEKCTFFEVDFQPVVLQKIGLLQQCKEMWETLRAPTISDCALLSEQYRLLSGNLENPIEVQKALDAAGIAWNVPTFILSECVLTYLPPKSSAAVLQWTASQFPNAVFLLYEQVCPDDAFGAVMLQHFQSLGSPILGIHSTPTLKAHMDRFLQRGWTSCCAHTVVDYYFSLNEEERKRVATLEPFDEWEEWHLKAHHYAAVTASRGQCCKLQCLLGLSDSSPRSSCDTQTGTDIVDDRSLSWQLCAMSVQDGSLAQRFGHCSVHLPSGAVLLIGGFGKEGHHGRLTSIQCIHVEDGFSGNGPQSSCKPLFAAGTPSDCQMFSSAVLLDVQRVMVFGGRSSPSKPSNAAYIIYLRASEQVKESANSQNSCQSASTHHSSSESQPVLAAGEDCSGSVTGKDRPETVEAASVTLPSCLAESTECGQAATGNSCPGSGAAEQCAFPTSCMWTHVECSGEKPSPRWRHSASILHCRGSKYMVVFGGCTNGGVAVSTCHKLNIDSLHWTEVFCPRQPTARHSHSACVWRDHILVIAGGLSINEQWLNDVWLLDLQLESPVWMELEVTLPRPCYSHSCCMMGDVLVIVGGVTCAAGPPLVMAIDLVTHSTVVCHADSKVGGLPVLAHNHTMHSLPSGPLLVLGGGGNCFSFGTHFNHSPLLLNMECVLKRLKLPVFS